MKVIDWGGLSGGLGSEDLVAKHVLRRILRKALQPLDERVLFDAIRVAFVRLQRAERGELQNNRFRCR